MSPNILVLFDYLLQLPFQANVALTTYRREFTGLKGTRLGASPKTGRATGAKRAPGLAWANMRAKNAPDREPSTTPDGPLEPQGRENRNLVLAPTAAGG